MEQIRIEFAIKQLKSKVMELEAENAKKDVIIKNLKNKIANPKKSK